MSSSGGGGRSMNYRPGVIAAQGAFSGEFGLGDELPIDEAPYVIERDRINEGVLPGFNRKLLPLRLDPQTGERTAGGYYLLETAEQAHYMYDWYQDESGGFILDGIPILKRAYFRNPVAHFWTVVGAEDFRDVHTDQKVVRFERWRRTSGDVAAELANFWPTLRDQARDLGLATVWLLYNPAQEDTIGLVTAAPGSEDASGTEPDFGAVSALADMPSLGAAIDAGGWGERSFDRTSWIFSIWFPYTDGPRSKPTLWPNSPPFPGLR